MTDKTQAPTAARASAEIEALIARALLRSGMSYGSFVRCLTQNAFRGLVIWSESDLERLLLACEELDLSPTGRDLFAVQQSQGHESVSSTGGVLLLLSVDGWTRIVNRHPQFDGMSFEESQELEDGIPAWISCTIHRRDRSVPLTAREYLCESRRDSGAWITHPRRMLRHRSLVQCARLAFGLPTSFGIHDSDEPPNAYPATRAKPIESGVKISCTEKLIDTLSRMSALN